MITKTKDIKNKLSSFETIEERLEFLKDLYKDETAYLVTCGPSLTTHDQQILKNKLKNKLVICAKQSLNYLNDICDFHLISCYNFQKYSYENENTIKWWQLTACNMDAELNRIVNEWKHDIDIYIPSKESFQPHAYKNPDVNGAEVRHLIDNHDIDDYHHHLLQQILF